MKLGKRLLLLKLLGRLNPLGLPVYTALPTFLASHPIHLLHLAKVAAALASAKRGNGSGCP